MDAFGVGQHLVVPEAEDAVALGYEEVGPGGRVEGVLAAIELDDQMKFETDEVDDIRSDAMLATELGAIELSRAQMAPKRLLCLGGVAPELSRSVGQHSETLHYSPAPSIPLTLPPLRGGPLPLPQGERETKASPIAPLPLGERGWGEGFKKKNPSVTGHPDA